MPQNLGVCIRPWWQAIIITFWTIDVGTPYKKSTAPGITWCTSHLWGCKAIHNISSLYYWISTKLIPVFFLIGQLGLMKFCSFQEDMSRTCQILQKKSKNVTISSVLCGIQSSGEDWNFKQYSMNYPAQK